MPLAVLKSIREVSSEDKVHCAANLLQNAPVRKWKTGEIGEKSAYVVIEMERAYSIKGIDIGNEASAFVEVLVGEPKCSADNFKEILITCSFMTPAESKAENNINRVRCFNKEALVKEIADEKWTLLKIVCTQPFNKHIQYGLSFIKVHVDEPVERTKSVDLNGTSGFVPKHTLAGFTVRDSSPDSESESAAGLFRRWKTAKAADRTGTSSIPRTLSPSMLKKTNESFAFKKTVTQNSLAEGSDSSEKPKVPDRNRDSLLFDDDEEDALQEKQKKRLAKLEKIIQADKDRLKKETDNAKKAKTRDSINGDEKKDKKQEAKRPDKKSPSKKSPVTPKQSSSSLDTSIKKTPSTSTSSSQRRPSSSPCDPGNSKRPKLEKNVKYKPFHDLLNGVVLVISGIQNPDRANLRTKALAMGAKYKPDWDNTSTHLICAFKNTPKYNQVKGHGKIITRKWIEDCHSQKKRLPWRRYALDTAEQSQPESDEEILDDSLKPQEKEPSPPPICNEDSDIEEIYDNPHHSQIISSGSDTEDEIQRVLATSPKKKIPEEREVFELTTEEEEYTAKLSKNDSKTFFKDMKFYVSDQISAVERMKVEQFIVAYQGELVKRLSTADYVITHKAIPCGTGFKGQMVTPLWIMECNDSELLIPTKRYLVT